jgi:hypothetical protein
MHTLPPHHLSSSYSSVHFGLDGLEIDKGGAGYAKLHTVVGVVVDVVRQRGIQHGWASTRNFRTDAESRTV